MDIKGRKMVDRDWAPHGKITQTLKDFLLMHEQAVAHGQKLPLAQTYVDLVQGCVAAGEGEWDNAAVMQEIRRRTS
jgi:3-hydroxyisobutyrate dehydrogenase-like beta-hydroxyacid dehydrogenase